MVCPDGIRVIMDETDAASVTTHQEYFYTPKSVYYRRVGGWVRISNRTSADECGSTPDLDALGIRMRLEDIFSGASIRAGDERMLDSETCRDYHVKVAWREFLICVNPTDHLPREIVSSLFKDENGQFVKPERARYSKWNSVQESDLGVALPSD